MYVYYATILVIYIELTEILFTPKLSERVLMAAPSPSVWPYCAQQEQTVKVFHKFETPHYSLNNTIS